MGQSRSKIVQRLTAAHESRRPITVRRKRLDSDRTSGFVVAVTDDWVVLHDFIESVYLDDLVLLRLDQVTKVERHSDEAYVLRSVEGLGEPTKEFDCATNATVGDLLGIIAERAELVCVRLEEPDSEWFLVGKILRIGTKRLDLHFIGRDGVWSDFVEAWKLKDITRIEFGGRYIRALERFGEPMPVVTSRKKR